MATSGKLKIMLPKVEASIYLMKRKSTFVAKIKGTSSVATPLNDLKPNRECLIAFNDIVQIIRRCTDDCRARIEPDALQRNCDVLVIFQIGRKNSASSWLVSSDWSVRKSWHGSVMISSTPVCNCRGGPSSLIRTSRN